ncbi:MAG TPA: rhomboid family intramembrane serine protease [Aquificaceae bacterium]|nr:rhomboid family intramembrane serine protease [Aquificaceae bacterium]HIQ31416.1 rhomboid family intramembrane serine protease [Aquifex aeolicus]
MIPLKDINPSRTFPIITVSIIFLCALVWLYEWKLSSKIIFTLQGRVNALDVFIANYGLVPVLVLERPYTLITHMFLHGGWFHVIGNMWFLWVFGDNIEDKLGRFKYVLFYLTVGVLAALTQIAVGLLFGGGDVPMVGASGAVSGVLGAYLKLFPHARVLALVPIIFFLTFVELPALLFIGMWFFIQLINGVLTLPLSGLGGVAWWAHIGGFVAGYMLIDKFLGGRRYYLE